MAESGGRLGSRGIARSPSLDRHGPAAAGTLPESLARALGWLEARPDRAVAVDDLAAAAGVRPRTLEAQFRRHLGTTPLHWARRTRLARARQQLLAGGAGANVTAIALANGFGQLGRFAGAYRQSFGERPSDTLRAAARGGAAMPPPELDEARRLSWRALTAAFAVGPGACSAALADLEAAQALAPAAALPKALAAWCWGQRAAHNFAATPDLDRGTALRLAAEAARLGPADALALSLCGGALTLTGRLSEADALIERALAIDPFSPWAWIRRGWLSAYQGDSEGALRELDMTLRLMPFEPLRHLVFIGMGCVHFGAGRYDRALRWIEDGLAAGPDSYWAARVAVAAAWHAGSAAEARRRARALLRREASLTVALARTAWPFPPAFMDRLGDGLAAAGIPRH